MGEYSDIGCYSIAENVIVENTDIVWLNLVSTAEDCTIFANYFEYDYAVIWDRNLGWGDNTYNCGGSNSNTILDTVGTACNVLCEDD